MKLNPKDRKIPPSSRQVAKTKSTEAAPTQKEALGSTPEVEVSALTPFGQAKSEGRVFKDELNLIEYPWMALWKHEDASTVISHEWDVPHPAIPGKTVRALWRVAGDPEMGLPTANDLRVYLVLMELTRDQGFPQVVYFTRYDLLKRLGWPDEQKRYQSLRHAFRRLKGVTISAQNAFRDGRTRALKDVEFSMLDNVEIVAARPGRKRKTASGLAATGASARDASVQLELDLPLSFFRWNDTIYNSLRHGYLATLDLDFALSLHNDVALSLYRLLSKKAHGNRSTFEMELSEFYHRHLGLRPTPYRSKMKERLKAGHDELIQRGFLRRVSYEPMKTRKGEKVVYEFSAALSEVAPDDSVRVSEVPVKATGGGVAALLERNDTLIPPKPFAGVLGSAVADAELEALAGRISALGVSPGVAQLLVETCGRETLQTQLDCLSDRQPKDAAATFVAAVKAGWQLPAAFVARREAGERAAQAETSRRRRMIQDREESQARAARVAAEASENETLDAQFESMPDPMRAAIDAEVRTRLKFVVQHLSEAAAQGGWKATRRQVMREQSERDSEAENGSLPRIQTLSERDVDALWDTLPDAMCQSVDERVGTRLQGAGIDHLKPQHPAWHGVRRTLLREMIESGALSLPC